VHLAAVLQRVAAHVVLGHGLKQHAAARSCGGVQRRGVLALARAHDGAVEADGARPDHLAAIKDVRSSEGCAHVALASVWKPFAPNGEIGFIYLFLKLKLKKNQNKIWKIF